MRGFYYFPGQWTGRPREHWRVSDYPHRLDANDIRRRVLADGGDPAAVGWLEYTHQRDDVCRTDRVLLSAMPDAEGKASWPPTVGAVPARSTGCTPVAELGRTQGRPALHHLCRRGGPPPNTPPLVLIVWGVSFFPNGVDFGLCPGR